MRRDIIANLILVGFCISLLYLFIKIAITGAYWVVEPNKVILGLEIAMVVATLGLGIERAIKHWRRLIKDIKEQAARRRISG